MVHRVTFLVFPICLLFAAVSSGWTQVVTFRLETTDLSGTPIDSIDTGEEFYLNTYTQHVNGYVSSDNSGVYAGFLDIAYDESLGSVAGDIGHGSMYSNFKSGDLSMPGLMDNVGGVSSSGLGGLGIDPIGLDEQFLLAVRMRADSPGNLSFVGSESLSYPHHDVLVYGLDVPVPANEVDFGAADVRIDFGATTLAIRPVPEPAFSMVMIAIGHLFVLGFRRRTG